MRPHTGRPLTKLTSSTRSVCSPPSAICRQIWSCSIGPGDHALLKHPLRCGLHCRSNETDSIVFRVFGSDLIEAATSAPVTLSRVPVMTQPVSCAAKEIVVSLILRLTPYSCSRTAYPISGRSVPSRNCAFYGLFSENWVVPHFEFLGRRPRLIRSPRRRGRAA
jgi:hypothetical protein